MPVNQFESAFAELLDVQELVLGTRKKATVGTQEVDAFIGLLTYEDAFMAGGIGENGGFEIQVKASLLTARPARMSKVTVDGRSLSVLRVTNANGIYTITAGDPAQ